MQTFAEFIREYKDINYTDELNESSLSRVYDHTKNSTIGIITAHRASNKPRDNEIANSNLHNDIRKAGFGLIHITGKYIENKGEENENPVTEKSFLVIGNDNDSGNLKGFLKKHGEKYGQDSVLYKPHDSENATLIGTRDSDDLKKGEERDIGKWHPNRLGHYQSEIKKNKSFVFEGFVYTHGKSFFTRRDGLIL